ncbi:MAG: amino acid ABC transporter permease [Alphaproteobacteria bacterium]|nr:MAG: amino acid ABC transporter permease [Alphaproteobacteria bacterium]
MRLTRFAWRPPRRRPIPGLDGTATNTDLPVLLPPPAPAPSRVPWPTIEGVPRLVIRAWHVLLVMGVFVLSIGVAYAQALPARLELFDAFITWLPFIMDGFLLNLTISFLAMAIGTTLGVGLGLMQISLLRPLRWLAWSITQFFRNTPWLVLLFSFMLLLPFEIVIGKQIISIPGWIKATFALSLPIMANIAEIVRGAVQSIPSGQWESAESLAFSRRQTLWMIILPQCVKRMIPPWMNWYAILTMATPLCSILEVQEIVKSTREALNAMGDRPELLAPFYSFILVVFFAYCYPIARWTIALERRYAVKI